MQFWDQRVLVYKWLKFFEVLLGPVQNSFCIPSDSLFDLLKVILRYQSQVDHQLELVCTVQSVSVV